MERSVIFLMLLAVPLCVAESEPIEGRAIKSCLSCEGETCARVSAQDRTISCNDDCVAFFVGFTLVKRTCYTLLSDLEKSQCDSTSEYTCYKCNEDHCNYWSRLDHKCLECTSALDTDCLQSAATIVPQRCPATAIDTPQCYVKVVNSSTTVRGCITTARELRDCTDDSGLCSVCPVAKDGVCNTHDYPVGRRRCVQCRGGQECLQQLSSAALINRASSYCHNPSDACVAINNRGNHTLACADTLTQNEKLFCAVNTQSCLSCNSDNCNRLLPPPPPVACTGSSVTNIGFFTVLIGFGMLSLFR